MPSRLPPLEPPYEPATAALLDGMMPPGRPPLNLFRTIAHNPRVLERFRAGGLLDRGAFSLRQREIVIDRTTANFRSEYEWGVHIAFFAAKVGFGEREIAATVVDDAEAACWTPEERLLLAAVDALCKQADWPDELYGRLKDTFTDQQLLELVALVGFYQTVSLFTNAFRIERETGAPSFPAGIRQANRV